MQLDDGSFFVPLMTCSDQVKFVRVLMQESKITIRQPTSSAGSQGFIEQLIRQGNSEVFQETKNLITMKKCLSREEVIKQIFNILELASSDDESFLLTFRLLAALLIRNYNDALVVFERLNGFKRLEQLLRNKTAEMQSNSVKRVLAQIVEIACNELNCSFRIDPNSNRKRGHIECPVLDDSCTSETSSSQLAFLSIA